MYEIENGEKGKTLYRINKHGDKIELCTIVDLESRRLLFVDIKECTPFIIDGEKKAVKKDKGAIIYSVTGEIQVLKKPHISHVDYEIHKQTRIAIADGRGGCDIDMVVRGISEPVAVL